jgi:hypothetical protein
LKIILPHQREQGRSVQRVVFEQEPSLGLEHAANLLENGLLVFDIVKGVEKPSGPTILAAGTEYLPGPQP